MGLLPPPVEPLVPLFMVLAVGKLGLCFTRTASAGAMPLNLALALASEGAFVALTGVAAVAGCGCRCSTAAGLHRRGEASADRSRTGMRLCCQRRQSLLLRGLLVPALQVLAIADFIYIALVGIPLRLHLVAFFVANLFSDYVQQILFIYVGVGVPLLAGSLLVFLAVSNHLLSAAVGAIRTRPAAIRNASVHDHCGGGHSRRRLALAAAATLLGVTAYSQGLPRHGSSALRYTLCGNVFTRGAIELGQSATAAISSRSHEEADIQAWPELRVQWPDVPEVTGRRRKRNVVVIGLETARADAFSPWRSSKGPPRTPFMDTLAQRGRAVQQAYTPTPVRTHAYIGPLTLETEPPTYWQ
jgi:hypothetical protein